MANFCDCIIVSMSTIQYAITEVNYGQTGDRAVFYFNRSLAWLRMGDFARGWPEYQWRRQCRDHSALPSGPEWDGSSLTGRRILVYAEQGILSS